jgi:hypothetical protein
MRLPVSPPSLRFKLVRPLQPGTHREIDKKHTKRKREQRKKKQKAKDKMTKARGTKPHGSKAARA